jgi:hypothetical protein
LLFTRKHKEEFRSNWLFCAAYSVV